MQGGFGSDGERPVVAAVDIGSNTIKLTVARVDEEGRLEELVRVAETVRLGMEVAERGRLAEDRVEAAMAVLAGFAARARAHGAVRFVGVATEAARAAGNGAAFLERVERETGLVLRTVSGDEEANLVFRGLAATTHLGGRVVAADIGGGSTEVLEIVDGELRFERSLRLGSGTLTDRHVVTDPPTAGEIVACVAEAAAALAGLELPAGRPPRLIVVGGTGRYLARLAGGDERLDLAAIDGVLAELGRASGAKVARRLGITPLRAGVLPAGVAVVRALAACVEPVSIEAARSTVRRGLLLATFEELGEAVADAGVEARNGAGG